MRRALAAGIIVLLVWGRLTYADILKNSPSDAVCRPESVGDLMLGFRHSHCVGGDSIKFFGVQEGDEPLLQRALRFVQNNPHQYAAVLFYAPWCPFSDAFQPTFYLLSSLYPTIPHFSVKESALRPSTLSKYGVHGFPSLYLLNTTMRVNYRGSRNLTSVLAFYKEVTGMESTARDKTSIKEINSRSNLGGRPRNVEDETYLALATIFVVMRLIYGLYPTLLVCGQCVVNYTRSMKLLGSLEHLMGYLRQATVVHSSSSSTCCFTRMETRKRSNFQEGAMNARVWASKSLATVSSIGEASTSSGRRSE